MKLITTNEAARRLGVIARRIHALQCALLATLLCLPALAQDRTIIGKVIVVADGDTITVIDKADMQYKIRLGGIDAPEQDQAFGDKARKSLSDLIYSRTVTVTVSNTVRDGLAVGKVKLNGKDINLEQIRRGFAWFYRQYEKELSQVEANAYELAEADARDRGRGLWASPGPIPPWELRAAQRSRLADREPEAGTGQVIGDRNAMIYHRPDCPDYSKVSERNRLYFENEADALAAGFRKAGNCPKSLP
ncbi:MAG: thermonuclease family protein [Acidobacteria bacterium]|nr:thermonuclease family protein [Acidobacteriota bacterium]